MMTKKINDFLQSYWLAKYNIGLRKIVLFYLFSFIILIVSKFLLIDAFIIIILVVVSYIIIKSLILSGYNHLVYFNDEIGFRVYDNKKLFSDLGTRNLQYFGRNLSSKVWLSKKKNKMISAYLNGLINYIGDYYNDDLSNKHFLHLGGGAGSLSLFIANKYKSTKHEVVELKGDILKVSKKYFYNLFGKNNFRNLKTINEDARKFLKSRRKFDIVIQDIFVNDEIPEDLLKTTWLKLLVSSVKNNGLIALNLGNIDREKLFFLTVNLSYILDIRSEVKIIKDNYNYYLVIFKK